METRERLRIVAATCVLVACLAASATARVIYVDDDATSASNGLSWANAFVHLQNALAVAQSGDEIQVAQGIYRPDQGAGIKRGDRQAVFHLVEGITLRGGSAGVGAADPNVRNIELYQTILSGDCKDDDLGARDADVLANLPSRTDNSFHVVVIEQVDSCVLDGLIIRGGQAHDGGGGLQIRESNPTLRNCMFTQNWGLKGGAVFISRGKGEILSNVTIHNCRFTVNSSTQYGGALCTEDDALRLSGEEYGTLLLSGCEFFANTSSKGGAVSSTFVAVSLSGCTFRANRAGVGGGLHQAHGSLAMTGCTFEENLALLPASGPYVDGEGGAVFADIHLPTSPYLAVNCLFRNNRAFHGGAIRGLVTVLRGCRFTGNVAYNRSGVFGGDRTLTAEDCLFDGNRTLKSISVAACHGALQFTNCTLVDNRSPDGNALYVSGRYGMDTATYHVLTNCIVWGTGHGLDPTESWLMNTSVTYCDIEGGYPGAGNLDLDPQWADPGHWDANGTLDDPSDDFWVEGDCHLKSQAGRWDPVARLWVQDEVTSPCIDAGDPATPAGDEPQPNGGRINMGAYGGTAEASKSLVQ